MCVHISHSLVMVEYRWLLCRYLMSTRWNGRNLIQLSLERLKIVMRAIEFCERVSNCCLCVTLVLTFQMRKTGWDLQNIIAVCVGVCNLILMGRKKNSTFRYRCNDYFAFIFLFHVEQPTAQSLLSLNERSLSFVHQGRIAVTFCWICSTMKIPMRKGPHGWKMNTYLLWKHVKC